MYAYDHYAMILKMIGLFHELDRVLERFDKQLRLSSTTVMR